MKIRSDILRTYQAIHTWTGITTGLFLFIAFFAGALTLFKPQIEQWATPPKQLLAAVEYQQQDELIRLATTQYEKAKEGFTLNFDGQSSPLTWFEKGGGRGLRLDDSLRHATLNDAGSLVTQTSSTNELGQLIDQLHRTAGIVGKLGHEDIGVLILGLAAGLYFLALVSGVVVLLPTLVKNLFALRVNKGANRFWLDSHNLVGVLSLPFHLMIAWTAIVFAFHDPFYGGLSVIYGDKPLFEPREKSTVTYSVEKLPFVETYVEQVKLLAGDYQIRNMVFSNLSSTSPSLAIELGVEGRMLRGGYSDFIYLQPYTMKVQYSTVPQVDSGVYPPIVNSFFALHFGNYAGGFGRAIYFVLGIMGAFLFYSGNLLWLEKRRQKQGEQTRSSRVMAVLTVGVCLGSILGVVLAMLATKWLYLISDQVNHFYTACYYSVFFLALGYSFYRGAALGAIHLLRCLSLVCLLIPVTSLLTFIIPGFTPWIPADFSEGLLEVMALVFALLFYFGARKTAKRAYLGERNSIWALSSKDSSLQRQQRDESTQILVN